MCFYFIRPEVSRLMFVSHSDLEKECTRYVVIGRFLFFSVPSPAHMTHCIIDHRSYIHII